MLRKKLISMMALALVSVFAIAVPAQADGTDDALGIAACVFEGNSGQAPTPVQAIQPDIANANGGVLPVPVLGNLLDTDGATFTFGGEANCLGADVAGESVGVATPLGGPFALNAAGRFTNLICGTGQAQGSATIARGGTNVTTDFGITFASGVGKIAVAGGNGQVALDVSTSAGQTEDVDNAEGDGVVNIIPDGLNGGGNCLDTDVSAFIVNGAFAVRLSGDAEGNAG